MIFTIGFGAQAFRSRHTSVAQQHDSCHRRLVNLGLGWRYRAWVNEPGLRVMSPHRAPVIIANSAQHNFGR
jgi:hypothetical protein